MSMEMVVVENDNRQMQMGNMRDMMVHDLMEMNGKNDWFSSKLVAEQSNKKHFTILRDVKMKGIEFCNGRKYWESVVNGGKTYNNFIQSDLNKIFRKLVVERDDTVLYHEFLNGLRYTFDERGYVKEFEMNGYVANHLMMSYSDELLWKWQMYTRNLYAENTELVADKYLGIFSEHATFNYNDLTKVQKIEISTRYSIEHALENGLDINPGLVNTIPKKKIKQISKTKKELTFSDNKDFSGNKDFSHPYFSDSKNRDTSGDRYLGNNKGKNVYALFGISFNEIFSYKDVIEKFNTTEKRFRFFLVEHKLINSRTAALLE